MPRNTAPRYADMARYTTETGELALWDAAGAATTYTVLADTLDALDALARLDAQAAAFGAGYLLALAARAWRGRPTESQRAAIIQAAERAGAVGGPLAFAQLAVTTQLADAALLAGQDAERAIVAAVDERVRRADRAASRCGRHGAGLLDQGDRVLAFGAVGPPLLALLGAAASADVAVVAAGEQAAASVCIVGALAAALDGAALVAKGAGALIEQARGAGLPCYLLAPSGPLPEMADLGLLRAGFSAADVVAPALISAFVTDRGIYRPPMLARYLSDADAPLDVIPLIG